MSPEKKKSIIRQHVTHPVCLTLSGAKAHLECYWPEDLGSLWDLCFAFAARDPLELPTAIWRETVRTRCGRLLN
jgi:hypothetical protein